MSSTQADRPVVVVSSCLAGKKVRYDGSSVDDRYIKKLLEYVHPVEVCPEMEIGLPVPRKKVFLYLSERGKRLIQEGTGADLTEDMRRFSTSFLDSLGGVDGFLLKAKSPSCGITGAKAYLRPDRKIYAGRKKGIFAEAVLEKYRYFPVTDEVILRDFYRRFSFLNRLYLFFYYRVYGPEYILSEFVHILELFNKKRTAIFKKNPDKENFIRIFSVDLTEKRFKRKIKNGELKKFISFPAELLDYPA
ncbi:DUF523 domain-containing protein [Persephonella sp.]